VIKANNCKFHSAYKVTCSVNGNMFFGVHSANHIDQKYTGAGIKLWQSKRLYGHDAHNYEVLGVFDSRLEAKTFVAGLKLIKHCTYKITRFDGKFYYGVHSTSDLNDGYMGSGKYLKHSLKKHGHTNHNKEVLLYHSTRAQALFHERELVTHEVLQDPLCMNIIVGGAGLEDTSKISISLRGKTQPQSVRDAISARRTGVPTTQRAVVIHGVFYPSAIAAAKALNVNDRTVTSRCRREASFNWCYADTPKNKPPPKPHPKAKKVLIDGVIYDRVGDAERALKVCRNTIKVKCTSNLYPTWMYIND